MYIKLKYFQLMFYTNDFYTKHKKLHVSIKTHNISEIKILIL
jgi:hypothetical protein